MGKMPLPKTQEPSFLKKKRLANAQKKGDYNHGMVETDNRQRKGLFQAELHKASVLPRTHHVLLRMFRD